MIQVTVITINRNNAAGLEKTMHSVAGQTFRNFQYIVVDGASTDGSVAVARGFDFSSIAAYRFTSEPDSGIYNAMNKGIDAATGRYLLFLNSGDTFADDGVLERIGPYLAGDADFVLGRVNVITDGAVTGHSKALAECDFTLYNMYLQGIPHQAAFIKRSLFDGCRYDESLRINSDWKFFVSKIVLSGASVTPVDMFIADYDGSGISSVDMPRLLEERERVLRTLLPERVAVDYIKLFPHSYEVTRLKWLLGHRFFYRLYRLMCSAGMKMIR